MTVVKTIFKSITSENRWIALQKEKAEIQTKPITSEIQDKIDVISSIMTSCKVGFNLSEAKVKKITKFLKETTGNNKLKYGIIPEDSKPKSILFKDVIVLYTESNGQIIFKENEL